MCVKGENTARAYVPVLPCAPPGRESTRISDIGGDRELSHGDLPTAIIAGVTHNNADVIAPRSRFHRTPHVSIDPKLDSFVHLRCSRANICQRNSLSVKLRALHILLL